MPGSEHLIGSSEPLPVRGAWRPDGVAGRGGDRRVLLLAAADGGGTARGRDGNHNQIHTQCRMEMVRLLTVCYHSSFIDTNIMTLMSLKFLQSSTYCILP